jgi:hypothetical protein
MSLFKKGHTVRYLLHTGTVEMTTPRSVRVTFYDGLNATGTYWQRPQDLKLVCKFCKRVDGGTIKSIPIQKRTKTKPSINWSAHENCFTDWAKTVLKKIDERQSPDWAKNVLKEIEEEKTCVTQKVPHVAPKK